MADIKQVKLGSTIYEIKDAVAREELANLGPVAYFDYTAQAPYPDTADTHFTDTTLTVSGQAADAKATGDAVAELKTETDALNDVLDVYLTTDDLEWELGGINGNGNNQSANTRWRMPSAVYVKKGSRVAIDSSYRFYLAIYSSWTDVSTFTLSTTVSRTNVTYTFASDAYVRIVLSDATSSTDVTNMKDTLVGALDVQLYTVDNATNRFFQGIGDRTSSTSQLASIDNALPQRCYTFTANLDGTQPTDYGTCATFNYESANSNGYMQLYHSSNGRVFSRIKWSGAWKAWHELINEEQNQLYNNYADISMFERVGVIGDSFAAGTIMIGGGSETSTFESLSWPQNLARQCGITAINYAYGGATTKTFLTQSTKGLPKVLSDINGGNACELYLLCLGINDSNVTKTGGLTYLGTSADINTSDYTQNADSFWGNYGRIIQQIMAESPNSKIVMCTYCRTPTTDTEAGYEAFNTAITEIATFFSIPSIVIANDGFFKSKYYLNHMSSHHPTAPVYSGYAKAINRLFANCVNDNLSYFETYKGLS